MNRALAFAVPPFLAATSICASCANVDVHFRSDQIDSGLGYWQYGVGGRPWYSLHWNGDVVSVRDGFGNADIYTVTGSACPGLDDAKAELMREVASTVTAMIENQPPPAPEELLLDGPQHRLVYYPRGWPDRLELTGFEEVKLQPWIRSVKAVRMMLRNCRDS
jgi:hypothetical protein